MSKSISEKKLRNLTFKGKHFIFIDVRSVEEFSTLHIENAINIPLEKLETELEKLPRHQIYVTVCGKGGGRSEKAADFLITKNYDAYFLEGGTLGWFKK